MQRRRRMNASEEKVLEESPLIESTAIKSKLFNIFDKIKPYILFVTDIAGLYLLWILVHFVASHLYVYYCVPQTILGFIISPFMVATPHCYAFRWCIARGAESITTMWIVLGTWIATKFALGIRS